MYYQKKGAELVYTLECESAAAIQWTQKLPEAAAVGSPSSVTASNSLPKRTAYQRTVKVSIVSVQPSKKLRICCVTGKLTRPGIKTILSYQFRNQLEGIKLVNFRPGFLKRNQAYK